MEHLALRDLGAPDHVEVLESITRFDGPIFTIKDDNLRFSSGEEARRQYMEHDDAVAIVALRGDGPDPEVLLIRQYRHAPRRLMWEIPAGLIDVKGEDPLETARRELVEEASLDAKSWRFLVRFVSSPGVSDEDIDIFLATDTFESVDETFERVAEEGEIEVRWVKMSAVLDAILAGDLTSPTLVTGVLAAHVDLQRQMGSDGR